MTGKIHNVLQLYLPPQDNRKADFDCSFDTIFVLLIDSFLVGTIQATPTYINTHPNPP
jgi:hypothetical protein